MTILTTGMGQCTVQGTDTQQSLTITLRLQSLSSFWTASVLTNAPVSIAALKEPEMHWSGPPTSIIVD